MAQITATNVSDLITAADIADNELVIDDDILGTPGDGGWYSIAVQIVTGSFKFNVGKAASLSGATWNGTTQYVYLFTVNETNRLHFKATTVGDSFKFIKTLG